jgi:hypothetical protein
VFCDRVTPRAYQPCTTITHPFTTINLFATCAASAAFDLRYCLVHCSLRLPHLLSYQKKKTHVPPFSNQQLTFNNSTSTNTMPKEKTTTRSKAATKTKGDKKKKGKPLTCIRPFIH